MSLSKDIPQKFMELHLKRKQARHVPIIVTVMHPPAIPEIAIQNLSDIVFTIATYYYGWMKCPVKNVFD
jgi:hypothetical protein